MKQKRKMDLIYTVIGVALMCPTMVIFNKYLVYKDILENPLTNPVFWMKVLEGFCQRAPLAFVLQFFVVQKFASKKAAQHTKEEDDIYYKMFYRRWFTVLVMCPTMALYSQLILILNGQITNFAEFINNWIPSMIENGMFAFIIHSMIIGPLNRKIFLAVAGCMNKNKHA